MATKNTYAAVSVTVTTTPTKLLTLLQAVDSTISSQCAQLSLQSEPGNAQKIRVGSSASMTSANCGFTLAAGTNKTYLGADSNNAAPLAQMYVMCDASTMQLNVEAILR